MIVDQAKQRAEKPFKQEERDREGGAAMSEYQANAIAARKIMARLRALRLAKEKVEAKAEAILARRFKYMNVRSENRDSCERTN